MMTQSMATGSTGVLRTFMVIASAVMVRRRGHERYSQFYAEAAVVADALTSRGVGVWFAPSPVLVLGMLIVVLMRDGVPEDPIVVAAREEPGLRGIVEPFVDPFAHRRETSGDGRRLPLA